MTAHRRFRLSWLLAICVGLVLSACSTTSATFQPPGGVSPTGEASPSTSTTPDQTSEATPSARTVQPVAGFQLDQHPQWDTSGETSPDRVPLESSVMPKGMTPAPAGTTMQTYLDQKISWTDCRDHVCATVQVPLNWDDPSGARITLALLKVAHTSATKKGTLFVNPGGPGGSGRGYASNYPAGQFPDYDVIGWDPRGAGGSTPVTCWDDAQEDDYIGLDFSPDTPDEWTALDAGNRGFAESCRKNSGALLDHISTIDTARDLDYLRYLVGDDTLTFHGVSYGTKIGATYAEMYPDRVGRLVLDSAVNITNDDSVIQAMGFDQALRAFAEWCSRQELRQEECLLGSTAQQVIDTITTFWDTLDAQPMKVGDRVLTQTMAVFGVALPLYLDEFGYDLLYDDLVSAIQDKDGSGLLLAADSVNGRDEQGRFYTIAFAFPAISCADYPDAGVASEQSTWDEAKQKAPIFGTYLGPEGQCTSWTAKPAPQIKLTAPGAAPILVLGSTGDSATPYQQAVGMAEQLDSGVLLTRVGPGHGAYSQGNECVRTAVEDYLNAGTLPSDGTKC